MRLRVTSESITDDRPLLTLLRDLPDDDRMVFVHGEEGIVAAGTAASIAVPTGPGRLAEARRALTALVDASEVDDPVSLPGSGLVAVGSFTFDPGATGSVLRIPRTVIGRRGGSTWRTTLSDGTTPTRRTSVPPQDVTTVDRPRYSGSSLDDGAWLEAVAAALDAIDAGRAEKVVLARDVRLWSRSPFRSEEVLERLAGRFPSCFTFLVDGLVGASPELLLRRTGAHVSSRVLAGTAPRGADPDHDARLAADLQGSAKDLHEHALAARSVVEVLGRACRELTAPDGPSIVRLDNVQHLGSDVTGVLDAPVHVLDLVEALHPTAAVGGTPRAGALALIDELEGMDRGRYAGPVGWCDARGDGEFAIALRCAELDGDRARLFAGAGIVAGSLPEAELMETWLKMRAMIDVLTRR